MKCKNCFWYKECAYIITHNVPRSCTHFITREGMLKERSRKCLINGKESVSSTKV